MKVVFEMSDIVTKNNTIINYSEDAKEGLIMTRWHKNTITYKVTAWLSMEQG